MKKKGAQVNLTKSMPIKDVFSPPPLEGEFYGLFCWGGVKIQQLFSSSIFTDDTPLHCAARAGNYKAVERLVEHGAEVNAYKVMLHNSLSEETPLRCAAKCGDPKTITVLLEKGALFDYQCLINAIRYARLDNLKAFVSYDHKFLQQKPVGEPSPFDLSPLDEACRGLFGDRNYFNIIRYLVEQGADLFSSDARRVLVHKSRRTSHRAKAIKRSIFYLDSFLKDLNFFADNPREFESSLLLDDGSPYPKELFLRQLYCAATKHQEYCDKLTKLYLVYSKKNELEEFGKLLKKARISDFGSEKRREFFKTMNLPINQHELYQLYGIKQINFYFK